MIGKPIAFVEVPNQRLFGTKAAAQYLGIHEQTLRKLTDLGELFARKMGSRRVYCVFRGKSSTDSDPKSSTHSDASHPVIPGAKHPAIPTRRHPLFGAYRNDWMSWRNRQPDSQ